MIRILIIVLLFSPYIGRTQIYINEIMSSNSNSISDSEGDFPDWIELYNAGHENINLNGYFLSDDDHEPYRWQFPDIEIAPNEYLVIFASGKDKVLEDAEIHTNFRINKQGEPIILSDSNGVMLDRFPPAYVNTDYSYGKLPDGSSELVLFKNPTPGEKNTGPASSILAAALNFSHESGFYEYDFLLSISALEEVEIRYTTDGTNPSDSMAQIYTSAIPIKCRRGEENYYAEIQTAEPNYWKPPLGEVDKINVVRAQAYSNGVPIGEEVWGSFWIGHHNPENNKFPVVSVITDPKNLFDYEYGIGVPGIYYDKGMDSNAHRRGRAWERDAIFTFFDENGVEQVGQKVGIRAHGGATRRFRQKTLRIYARNSYGKEYIKYPFFERRENDKFKRLLLNTTMGDWSKTLFKDELCAYIIRDLDVDYLEFLPVVTFINGEYWGVSFIKERRDDYFIAQNHDIEYDRIDRLSNNRNVESGSRAHYDKMIDFIDNADPTDPKTYTEIRKMMQIENFIDYKCMQIFFNNRDWPHNNVEYWRPDTIGGKWRWMFIDLDGGFRAYQEDNFEAFVNENVEIQYYKEWGFSLLRSLLKIPQFKTDFTNRFYYHLNNTVRPDVLLEAIDKFKTDFEPYIANHINRWQFPGSIYEWEQNISVLESFAMLRHAEMKKILEDNFANPFYLSPNPAQDFIKLFGEGFSSKHITVSLYDIKGRKIHLESRVNYFDQGLEINLHGLNSGLYVVRIINNGMVFNQKFIKTNCYCLGGY